MKKRTVLIIAAICLLCFAAFRARAIGRISGAENDYITIDGTTYVRDTGTGLSYADKGRFMGRAVNADTSMWVYSVKGDADGQYIYVLWEWEGCFYVKAAQ